MTTDERNLVLETVDILRTLGGQNGFTNLQPKLKRMLLQRANALNAMVEKDIRGGNTEEFDGETVYEGDPNDFKVKL